MEQDEPVVILLRSKSHYDALLALAEKKESLTGDQCIMKGEMLYDLRQCASVYAYNSAIINSQLMAEARAKTEAQAKKAKTRMKTEEKKYQTNKKD